ncbi:PhnE/PtxC family ABC transporter permease [Nonomuraea sediminis]|uniref:PhnE/PtxC family ABC transporter permease n=1 Tax=Nonomuraea sediminis TaxID=2835864 RepID=UPI001BDD96C9|nr:ABC transporter permease subunit [Nonomuraea sediminis]
MTTTDLLRPPRTARRTAAWAFPLVFGLLGVAALSVLGVNLAGFGEVGGLLARAWPPTLSDPATTFAHVLDTLWMAIAGTALAALLAAVLAVCVGTRARPVALAVIVACRAVPDIVFAVFFVAALGIGPLPGVLALGLHSVGMLGKLFAEAVERADTGVREAVAGTGASPLQRLTAGVLPQVAPAWVAAVLYRLDINFRGSVLLGAVGAGGIGLDLKTAFGFTDYPEATGIALVTVAVVLLVEAVSVGLRGQLLGAGRAVAAPSFTGTRVPWTRARTIVHLAGWGGLLLAAAALWQVGFSPAQLLRSVTAIGEFLPPDFGPILGLLGPGLAETCAIALGATFLGVLSGVPLGLLAARAVAPHPVVRLAARAALVGLRSIPDLLLVLIFVAAFGLMQGAVAGTLALAVFTAALVAKLVADEAEELRRGPREALLSAGAGPAQELTVSLFGQLTPRLVATTLYALDVNLRAFFVLGIVGAGGLGFALSQHIRALDYDVVTAIVLPVFAIVLFVEGISTVLRSLLR